MTVITSRQNPRVKYLSELKDRKFREQEQCFLVEGFREVQRALESSRAVKALYLSQGTKPELSDHLRALAQARGIPVTALSLNVFEKLSHREHPDGCLAVVNMWDLRPEEVALSVQPLILVAEGLEKPGNLGALMRTAEGAGVEALFLCNPTVDVYNPNVIRASQGAVFSLPMAIFSPESLNNFLKEKHIQALATSPEANEIYWDANYTLPTAILVGNEHSGLSDGWSLNAQHVRIPMLGKSDSLNVHTAATLVVYEALRQRRGLRVL